MWHPPSVQIRLEAPVCQMRVDFGGVRRCNFASMVLLLSEDPALLERVRNGDRVTPNSFVELIRRSYPELWRQVFSLLVKRTETIAVEVGDTVLVKNDDCVVSGTPVLRRTRRAREEDLDEARSPERRAVSDGGTSDDDPLAEFEEHERSWEISTKVHGIVSIDRPASLHTPYDRPGQVDIITFENLPATMKEVPLKFGSDAVRREFTEAFATRCIPVALNSFFNVRMLLAAPDAMLLARPELHGTDRLQEQLRNPTQCDSEHLLLQYKERNRPVYQFFEQLRDRAVASEDRCSEMSLEDLPRNIDLEILTALAVPQIYGTLCSQLRMQFMFVQPSVVVGATIVSASATVQRLWDPNVQLSTIARSIAHRRATSN